MLIIIAYFKLVIAVLSLTFLSQCLLMMYICCLGQFGSLKSMFYGRFDLFYFNLSHSSLMTDNDFQLQLQLRQLMTLK